MQRRSRGGWLQSRYVVLFPNLFLIIRQGGHTLPGRHACATQYSPARTGFVSTLLTQEQPTTVLANRRLHAITFGHAYSPLAQVAMTRVLYRRYLRGEMSKEGWVYRQRQPYRTVGSLNLRLYSDKTWYERGGGGEFMLSISMFSYRLPFMTPGGRGPLEYHAEELLNGTPPFSDLLTFDRKLHRARLIKKQAVSFFSHAPFSEVIRCTSFGFARCALRQSKVVENVNDIGAHGKSTEEEVLAVTDMPGMLAHGGSSLGNVCLFHRPSSSFLFSTHY